MNLGHVKVGIVVGVVVRGVVVMGLVVSMEVDVVVPSVVAVPAPSMDSQMKRIEAEPNSSNQNPLLSKLKLM